MAGGNSLYQATLAGRLEVYDAYVAAGKGLPFVYPWDSLPALYIVLGVLIRPRLSPSLARPSGIITFLAVVVHSTYIVVNRRSIGFASGYGIGLAAMWGAIATWTFIVLHDPNKDFARLEIWEAAAAATYTQTPEGVSHSVDKSSSQNGVTSRQTKGLTQTFTPKDPKQKNYGPKYRLVWQTFPSGFMHSIDWTVDLITSFRGPNWNFRILTLPKIKTLPPPSQYQITRTIEPSILANEIHNPSDPSSASLYHAILHTGRLYLFIDIIKIVMITDPYFLGLRPLDSPSPWPLLEGKFFLTKLTRLLISLTGVLSALSVIFSLSPLFFFSILSALVPQQTLLKYTRAPLYDPRMYADLYVEPLTSIANKGLAGFWGKSWHQMFRYGISEPSKPIVKALGIDPRSQVGRAIQSLVAFCLSGMIHASASYTTFSIIRSKPLDPWLFFMLQGVGTIIQTAFADLILKQMKIEVPKRVRQAGNWAFVLVWLFYTGPLLANDFARAGIWLFEPVPVSLVRGVMGQGWWHWGGRWFGLRKGEGIFDYGIIYW